MGDEYRKQYMINEYMPKTPWLGNLAWDTLPRPIWAGPDPIFLAAGWGPPKKMGSGSAHPAHMGLGKISQPRCPRPMLINIYIYIHMSWSLVLRITRIRGGKKAT